MNVLDKFDIPNLGAIGPSIPPPGVTLMLIRYNDERPRMPRPPTLQLAHTNAGQREATVKNVWDYIHNNPEHTVTVPHFQVARDGSAGMFLELDRRGIANSTVAEHELPETHPSFPWRGIPLERRPRKGTPGAGQWGDIAWWSWAIETSDTGTKANPEISPFTLAQAETVARIFAYGNILYGIPLALPTAWFAPGSGSHTDPFGYPFTTIVVGKPCPGAQKKIQVRELVIPRARTIAAAWAGTPSPPPPNPKPPPPPTTNTPSGVATMGAPLVIRYGGTPTANWSGYFSFDGINRHGVRGMHHAAQLVALGAIDAKRGEPIKQANWSDVTHTTNAEELDEWLTPGRD